MSEISNQINSIKSLKTEYEETSLKYIEEEVLAPITDRKRKLEVEGEGVHKHMATGLKYVEFKGNQIKKAKVELTRLDDLITKSFDRMQSQLKMVIEDSDREGDELMNILNELNKPK